MGAPVTLACLLLLLHLTAGTSAKPHYVVVSPAVLYHPHTGMVSVHLSDLNETVRVSVRLEREDGPSAITLLEREVQERHLHENVRFQVPAPSRGQQEVAELHVSIRGDALQFSERKKVLLQALQPRTFVQTDKAIYKPGQTVKFRIVSLDKDFVPSTRKLPLVTVQDPSGNCIAQWRDVTPQQGIVDLSLLLSAELALGTYAIKAQGTRLSFSVEEYVLPKFKVTLELPPVVTVLDETLLLRVCGRDTSGKPVLGRVQASLCREKQSADPWYHFHAELTRALCTELTGQTDSNGCFSSEVEIPRVVPTDSGYGMSLQAKASLVEEGTGVELNATKSCDIMSIVTFEDADATYKAGIPYTGKMLLKTAGGSVLKNEKLQLFVSYGDKNKNQTFLTDKSGRASFDLDTSGWTRWVTLRGHYKQVNNSTEHDRVYTSYPDAHRHLTPFYSKSQSFLKIRSLGGVLPCDQAQQLQVDYVIAREALGNGSRSLDFIFLVVAKGAIARILHKGLDLRVGAGLKGSFSVKLPVGADLAPAAMVLGYTVLPNGELAADRTRLRMAKCFPNKVKLAFSQDRALPGSELQLRVQAAPGSLCAVRAVDQSVLLMKPEAELSVDTVYNLLPNFPQGDYPDAVRDLEPCDPPHSETPVPHCRALGDQWRCRRGISSWTPPLPNAYSLFKDAALKILTNTNTKEPCEHKRFITRRAVLNSAVGRGPALSSLVMTPENMEASVDSAAATPVSNAQPVPEPSTQEEPAPRAYFPETWLWDLVPVGEGGSKDIPVSVPDTITEWKAGMFCTAEVGFGLSPTATFTAFKPFFVELALPYSVIRGEAFALKATVFNYLRQCIKVQLTLAESAQFQVQAGEDGAYTSCLCADEGKTFQWEVTASSLGEVNFTVSTEALRTEELCGTELAVVPAQGRVDTVIKPLLVQPGGILEEKAHSSLLCQEASEEISLQLPANVLAGSERAHVTVHDIMATALQNIDRLLGMSDDNGEENMVWFAPNIYTQQYLEKTGQLSPEIRDKAQGFLRRGYQRELLYKHNDGSYSAFGESDARGNTWLTAFVLKSFGQARPYISIDEKHLEDALRWLQRRQRKTGCFRSVGKLLNNALQGGVVDELSLSAYITAALLELGQPLTDPMVTRALQCLRESSTSDLYTQALLAYAFGLAGSTELRDTLLQRLAQHSVSAGGQLHWQRKVKALPSPYWNQAPSAEVEMTAYVLLAYLSLPNVSAADMATATQIVRWLSKQQKPFGGFASMQDTVVALQALAKYAALTYSASMAVSVTVSSQAGARQQFHVENANRLVLQRAALQDIPGQYTVRASGKDCVFVQLTLRYNVPPPKSAATFDLRVETEPKECTESARSRFSLVLHARYSGEHPASNMAIIEVKLPSGYTPVKSSLRQLEKQRLVKRLEVQNDQVMLYLDQLTKEAASFTFSLEQDFPVKNLRAAPVRLYDYYETGEHTEAEYSAPCSSGVWERAIKRTSAEFVKRSNLERKGIRIVTAKGERCGSGSTQTPSLLADAGHVVIGAVRLIVTASGAELASGATTGSGVEPESGAVLENGAAMVSGAATGSGAAVAIADPGIGNPQLVGPSGATRSQIGTWTSSGTMYAQSKTTSSVSSSKVRDCGTSATNHTGAVLLQLTSWQQLGNGSSAEVGVFGAREIAGPERSAGSSAALEPNVLADTLSRRFPTHGWSIRPDIVHSVFRTWGFPRIDLFASRINRKCPVFCSFRSHSLGSLAEAFQITWSGQLLNAFPPFPLVHKVLLKVRRDKADVILVAPVWSRQCWYPTLLDLSIQAPLHLPLDPYLISQNHGRLLHPDLQSLHLTIWRIRG
ncbi:alpha-2-macroglobulin-like protein 1 [Emys orbicularis]|uniref:alpha-2-macroglobulin-like protein 1 n=1 Tax=Emys orbicularis TaxID=82168 RepID=UPI0031FC90A1